MWGNFIGVWGNGLTVEPNHGAGILVQSTATGTEIGTDSGESFAFSNLISVNLGNGIEFPGNAYGAEVTDTAVGANYDIEAILPNLGHGIGGGGNSSQIAIGGFQPSIERIDGGFGVQVGGNAGNGVVFQGRAPRTP